MGIRLFPAYLASILALSLLAWSAGADQSQPGPGSAGSTGATSPSSAQANAQAGGPVDPATDFPWNNSQTYESCGQTCILQKANENLSMQALYILNRVNSVQKLAKTVTSKKASTTAPASQEETELVAQLCPDKGTTDIQDCVDRYTREQVDSLRKIKSSIARNQNALIYYRSDVETVRNDGTVVRKSVSPNSLGEPDTGGKKLPQSSYATYLKDPTEVKAAYDKETANLQSLASQHYADWANNRPAAPTKEDFYMWKSVQLDPSDPQAGKAAVLLYEADGKTPKIDNAAFTAATKEYVARSSDLTDEKKDHISDEPTQKLKTANATELSDYQQAYNNFMNGSGTKPGVLPMQTFNGPGKGPGARALATTSAKATNKSSPRQSFTTFSPEELEKEISGIENTLPDCKDHGGCSYDPTPP